MRRICRPVRAAHQNRVPRGAPPCQTQLVMFNSLVRAANQGGCPAGLPRIREGAPWASLIRLRAATANQGARWYRACPISVPVAVSAPAKCDEGRHGPQGQHTRTHWHLAPALTRREWTLMACRDRRISKDDAKDAQSRADLQINICAALVTVHCQLGPSTAQRSRNRFRLFDHSGAAGRRHYTRSTSAESASHVPAITPTDCNLCKLPSTATRKRVLDHPMEPCRPSRAPDSRRRLP